MGVRGLDGAQPQQRRRARFRAMRLPFALAAIAIAAATPGCTKQPPASPRTTTGALADVGPPPDPRVSAAERTCHADGDCVLTSEDCCGCNGLGRQTAIRKDHADGLAARRISACASIACASAMSDDASCTARRAVCKAGACEPEVVVAAPAVGTRVAPIGD